MMNYSAFGEYIASIVQCRDAAARRYRLLGELAHRLRCLAGDTTAAIDVTGLQVDLIAIMNADREMRAALMQGNHAADLSNQPRQSIGSLATAQPAFCVTLHHADLTVSIRKPETSN